MAQIKEELLVIRVSSLVKDGEETAVSLSADSIKALEEAITDMVGQGKVVEITREDS